MMAFDLDGSPGLDVVSHLDEDLFGFPEQAALGKVHILSEEAQVALMLVESPRVLVIVLLL